MQTDLDVTVFHGHKAGPHLLLTGAVHGNETAGPLALTKLIAALNDGSIALQNGTVTIIPVCNPEAYKRDVRFVESNLNRVIRNHDTPQTYEEKLAQNLVPYIKACDYMLDIHSTHEPDDPAFSFMDENHANCVSMAKSIGIETLLVGWEDVYKDEDHSTEAYANRQGKTALTLECGYHKADDAAKVAWQCVINTLIYLGMIDHTAPTALDNYTIYRFLTTTRYQDGDRFAKNWKHLSPVAKGEIIYTTADGRPVTAEQDGYILIPNHNATAGTEMFYFGIKETDD